MIDEQEETVGDDVVLQQCDVCGARKVTATIAGRKICPYCAVMAFCGGDDYD